MKKILLFPIITITLFLGCQTVIDIKIADEPPKLVINSTLDPDEFIKVHVSLDQHILLERDYKTISAAQVEIFENGTLFTTLPDSTNGYYISATHKPQKGKTYRVSVSKEGFENASAKVIVPMESVKISSIKMDTVEQEGGKYLQFSIELIDDKDIENFYEISILREAYKYNYDYSGEYPVLLDSSLIKDMVSLESNDPGLEEFQTWGTNRILYNDDLFNGKTYNIKVLTSPYYSYEFSEDGEGKEYGSNPKYHLVVGNTSKSYFSYELSYQLQEWTNDDPFSEPVQVYNNITNGYGILGACNYSSFVVE